MVAISPRISLYVRAGFFSESFFKILPGCWAYSRIKYNALFVTKPDLVGRVENIRLSL